MVMTKEEYLARTMHSPDDPPRAAQRAALRDVSKALLPLHRTLIEGAKEDYGLALEPVNRPAHLLQLLGEDPFFAWLKPVTSLIVDLDEMVRREFVDDDAKAILDRLHHLWGPDADPEFTEHYVPIMQRDVDAAIFHAVAHKTIGALAETIF